MRAGYNRVRVMKVGLVSFREIGTGPTGPIETQWEGWSLMIFCARATRGRGLPSPGLMARPGKSIVKQSEGRAGEKCLPVGGRVRKSRAVGDESSPPSRGTLDGLWLLDALNGDHISRLAESR